jgi:hypothetical protein
MELVLLVRITSLLPLSIRKSLRNSRENDEPSRTISAVPEAEWPAAPENEVRRRTEGPAGVGVGVGEAAGVGVGVAAGVTVGVGAGVAEGAGADEGPDGPELPPQAASDKISTATPQQRMEVVMETLISALDARVSVLVSGQAAIVEWISQPTAPMPSARAGRGRSSPYESGGSKARPFQR